MSLVADYSSDNDSSADEHYNTKNSLSSKKIELTQLPSATSLLCGKPGEVFNNIYKKAEDMKIASLEKHCKMVENEDHIKEKNGKKICWNYRKGRCRFGSNCTFAHDSDLHDSNTNSRDVKSPNQDIPNIHTPPPPEKRTSSLLTKTNLNNTQTVPGITGTKRTHSGPEEVVIPPLHNKKLMKTFITTDQQQHLHQPRNKRTS